MSSDGLGIYKTAGTTSRERWKNRAQVLALLILGWVVCGAGLVLASTTLWHSDEATLWLKIMFAVWDLIMFGGLALITADVVRTFRTDWILHKAREGNA